MEMDSKDVRLKQETVEAVAALEAKGRDIEAKIRLTEEEIRQIHFQKSVQMPDLQEKMTTEDGPLVTEVAELRTDAAAREA